MFAFVTKLKNWTRIARIERIKLKKKVKIRAIRENLCPIKKTAKIEREDNSMKENLFKLMLNVLQPQTLAYLVRDLNDSLEEWQYYPEDAPPEPLQQELRQTLAAALAVGIERGKTEGVDFAQLMKQATADQEQADWRWQRNQQVQQNWTDDLQ